MRGWRWRNARALPRGRSGGGDAPVVDDITEFGYYLPMTIQHRLTSKAQVTIPKDVRDELGMKPGDLVRFDRRPDGAITIAKGEEAPAETTEQKRARIRAAIASVRGTMDLGGMTTDEYMREIRGDWEP
jgi:antitoxin PrlF